MNMSYAIEPPVHLLSEKRSEVCKRYSEVSIAGEKCAGDQELTQRSRLCRMAGGRGA